MAGSKCFSPEHLGIARSGDIAGAFNVFPQASLRGAPIAAGCAHNQSLAQVQVFLVNPNGLILLLEECADEALQIQEALRARGIKNPVYTLHSPGHAIQFLESFNGTFRNGPAGEAPELVLVSLGADAAEGFPLLRWMRESARSTEDDPAAIVLADAGQERRLQEALDLGASGFYIRNGILSELAETIYSLEPRRSNLLRETFDRPRSQRLSEQDSTVF